MALDAANFISELSITDPPGSDPLSQGDDQIRTCKRSVFNSLPLLDKAVNITADQMNLMAIKNEANVFTLLNTFNANIRLDNTADRGIQWATAGVFSWEHLVLQSGSNDVQLIRYVGGISQGAAYSISNATGVVDFDQVPTVQGAPLWIAGEVRQFVDGAATPGTNWLYANGTSGTIDLRNRILMGDQTAVAGTLQAPNLVATAAAGVTGATALTEAQMPAHVHQHGMTQTDQLSADTTNIEDQSAGTVADDPTRPFHVITEPTGGGGSHTHSSPAQAVTENGTNRDTVRPLSAVVRFFQYVP